MNPHQQGTLPINTIQNPKNDGHCIIVIMRGGKQTIDVLMPTRVESKKEPKEDGIEVVDEPKDQHEKEAEVKRKIIPMSIPPTPFPQRLVKKTE